MASISTCLTLLPKSRLFTTKPSVSLKFFPGIQTLTSCPTSPRKTGNFFRPRVSFPVVKASLDVGSNSIRPGGAVETDKLPSDVRKRTMEAVDALGGRVTIGDVSSKAGLNLNQAQKALQALASDTNGFLEVSDEGDVLYVFPKDYRAKLAAKSLRIRFEPWVDKAKAALEYLVRVSFGTALIASIVLVYTTIIALITSRSDEDNRGRRGRSYDTGFTFYFSPTDLFWYWDPYYYRRRRLRTDDDEKMNFIESVFSFVFGDGDPNQGIEEERWKLIGQYIASNGGVVAAEELAPYLDLQTTNGAMSDESYVLPVLLRFDGQPEIDEEGNILYRFPSLQRTASSQRSGRKEYVGRRWSDWVGGIEKFFREKKWQFSKTSSSETAMVFGLGGINLFGVIILGAMLKDTAAVTPSGFIKFVTDIFPLLQIYAGSFFAIPLLRWFIIRQRNTDIEKRNQVREQFARALELPDLSLRRKLLSARDMAQKTVIGPDRIVYSTDRDLVEQDYEAREWDRRFREIEKSE
ncbi:Iron-sulfur cluster biosynthesis family protein isoform 1 [Theobroma cacao]|uniref:Iron-sulfur cluster biosynthesis family protein isoform 1 n=1 Tax=Theobroma cacao TaxID=3641 RepID=A0A061ETV8_THECC|nr:Iron-sulfur cluster biosynthesis family protein isoform 1 [Theobroma cacao]EOY08247.1 Iron-sulfur cluster biosynthesis family protein isoform 1 [Theobroma cacao]